MRELTTFQVKRHETLSETLIWESREYLVAPMADFFAGKLLTRLLQSLGVHRVGLSGLCQGCSKLPAQYPDRQLKHNCQMSTSSLNASCLTEAAHGSPNQVSRLTRCQSTL